MITNGAPWTAYGQCTTVPNGSVDNPTANLNGLRGEVSLPYTVPAGKELWLTAYGGEAYNVPTTSSGAPQGVVYVPYIGTTPPSSNNVFLHSVYASLRSNETTGVNFIIPAGKTLNYRVQSSYTLAWVVGWYMRGTLRDVPLE